jgi:hypothetical protein
VDDEEEASEGEASDEGHRSIESDGWNGREVGIEQKRRRRE